MNSKTGSIGLTMMMGVKGVNLLILNIHAKPQLAKHQDELIKELQLDQ